MSHLVGSTHALLSTPSASALFDEDVILQSLTQLRDDSQLSLLKKSFLAEGWEAVGLNCFLLRPSSGRCVFVLFLLSLPEFFERFSRLRTTVFVSPGHWSKVAFKGNLGWGANLQDRFVLGRWSIKKRSLLITLCELRAIHLGLQYFRHSLRGLTVGVFTDNTTALPYVKKQGGRSRLLSTRRSSSSSGGRNLGNLCWFPNSSWGPGMWWPAP